MESFPCLIFPLLVLFSLYFEICSSLSASLDWDEVYEWIGACHANITSYLSLSSYRSFASEFRSPADFTNGAVGTLGEEGFLSPQRCMVRSPFLFLPLPSSANPSPLPRPSSHTSNSPSESQSLIREVEALVNSGSLSWGVVTVWGYDDSPISWGHNVRLSLQSRIRYLLLFLQFLFSFFCSSFDVQEHYKVRTAENDYSYLILPNSSYVLYQSIGELDQT